MNSDKFNNLNISQEQCKLLASYFYKDIAKYVKENNARYLLFVESENRKEKK